MSHFIGLKWGHTRAVTLVRDQARGRMKKFPDFREKFSALFSSFLHSLYI